MNSLYISYDGALEPLGQSQIIAYLKRLTKKGMRFSLLTFDKNRRMLQGEARKLRQDLAEQNIKWVSLQYHKRPPVLSTGFDLWHGFVVCLVIAIKEKIEIVHARSYVSALIALVLKKILRLKFIFDMRGFWADERVEGKIWPKKAGLYHFTKLLEKYFFKNADQIIVLTEHAKRVIKSWGYGVNNVSVIPCCVDTDSFRPRDYFRLELRKKYNLNGKLIFVHTGSLEYWYMKEEMLDYFKVANELEPRAHFLILTHADKDKILQLVLNKNLDPEDFTILSAPYVDMPKYLTMVDVGIIFITPVFSKMACSPTKFAEYLSSSVPVIINEKVGELEDYVLRNNIGVVVRDFKSAQYKETFADLLSLLKDKDLRLRCRQVACNNFNLSAGADKYYKVYTKLR